jgi:hypothetical protein
LKANPGPKPQSSLHIDMLLLAMTHDIVRDISYALT